MNKLTKLLSVFVIAGAVGAGIAGIAGCKKDNTPTPAPHEHSATEWKHDDIQHWQICPDDNVEFRRENHKYDNDQDASCNTCGYERTVTPPPAADTDVPEGAVGIKVVLVHDTVELNKDNPTTTLTAADLELNYIDSNQAVISGSTVDKSKCTIEIMKGMDILEPGAQLTKGDYVVMVTRNSDVFGTANLTVTDPVQAGSLALQEGAVTTQEQGEDTISSSLKWEVTLASGAKEEVTPTVTGVDTYGAGENKTANAELEMDGKTLTKEFTYSVTDKAGYAVQSAIINVNKLTISSGVVVNTDLGNGVAITAKSGKAIDIQASEKQADGKAFTQRIKMGGSPIKNDALDGTTVFRTVQFADLNAPVDGATSVKTKITIYASSSSSGAVRDIGLYKEGTKTAEDGSTAPTLTLVESKQADAICKLEWTVTDAGTYHIASASSGWYVHYIRVDKIIEGGAAAEQPINAASGLTLASLEKTVPEEVQTFTVGDTFSTEGIQVLGIYANDVTCDVSKKDVSADSTLTYSGYDMATPGKQTVTIEYGGKKTTYDITVETPVAGVYGVEAALKAGVSTQIAASSSDTSITIRKSDIEAKLLGVNATATISYTVKEGETEIDEANGLALAKGKHTLSVEITVSDGTNNYTETVLLEVTITKEGEASPVSIISSNLTAGTANLAADEVVADEALAKVTLLTGCKVEANTGTAPYTNRIKTNGSAKANQKAIKVEVTAPAKITVLYKKGSADTRQLSIYSESEGALTALKTAAEAATSSELFTFEYDITAAGTYYLGGDNGINIFEINIDPA